MVQLGCLDGSVLQLQPVPVLDRGDVPYEVVLRLQRDGALFAEVGQRCAGAFAEVAARLRASAPAFPADALREELALRDEARPLLRLLPREQELLALRARDPDDVATAGELRVWVRHDRTWTEDGWRSSSYAVVDAWDGSGRGVRAHLDAAALLALLDDLLAEAAAALEPGGV